MRDTIVPDWYSPPPDNLNKDVLPLCALPLMVITHTVSSLLPSANASLVSDKTMKSSRKQIPHNNHPLRFFAINPPIKKGDTTPFFLKKERNTPLSAQIDIMIS